MLWTAIVPPVPELLWVSVVDATVGDAVISGHASTANNKRERENVMRIEKVGERCWCAQEEARSSTKGQNLLRLEDENGIV